MSKQKTIFVCINKKGGQACIGPKSREVFRELHKRARERAEAGGEAVTVERMTCLGECSNGPNAKILGGRVFNHVTPDDVDAILDAAEQTPAPRG